MATNSRFRVNRPEVISETIDGETVVVDFESGNYYSLDQTGAVIWGLLDDSATVGEIVETLAHQYTTSSETIVSAVAELLAQLEREGLIVPDDGQRPRGERKSLPPEAAAAGSSGRPFEAPVLHKYTDMQELLLLDPIHEVDDAGWPVVRADQDG